MICNDCPFRSDKRFPLGRERMKDIADAISHDGSFPCHKTTGPKGETLPHTRPCEGAAKFLEQNYRGGLRSNVCYRLALAAGRFTLDSIQNDPAPVYQSLEELLERTDA